MTAAWNVDHFNQTWNRFESNGQAVYISRDSADWFAPNEKGDAILSALRKSQDTSTEPMSRLFLSRLPRAANKPYDGTSRIRYNGSLKELWFHITNRCNLACSHCLFSSSPAETLELEGRKILTLAEEGYDAGCRLFALTGGEPLVHPHIDMLVPSLLKLPGSHVAMLTNGLEAVPFVQRHNPDPHFFHLQISVDGMETNHDAIRSKGSFKKLTRTLETLKKRSFPFTLSMCVTRGNVHDMPAFVDYAATMGASNVHFMWYFIRGRGATANAPDLDTVFDHLVSSADIAKSLGVTIDNLEALKTQVFAAPGTIHDGSSAGLESLAVGPCGNMYPSAALVGVKELAWPVRESLMASYRENPVFRSIRSESVASVAYPFRYILGGGDLDQCYIHNGSFMGHDPYQALHERLVLWLIAQETARISPTDNPAVLLRTGDILESCGAHGDVAFVHTNCLLAASQPDSLASVKDFYSDAASETKEDILNPVCYEPSLLSHIPHAFRFRGYGCGSPVLDADIRDGEHVADLGAGRGVECFIAARLAGKEGKVTGVDMLDPMLAIAETARFQVEKNLGYSTLSFKKGYLENLPLKDDSTDVVISNCVMNLSVHKIKAFAEIFRVLKPGGRLVISDVVCETEPGPFIRNDETLKGECIAGSLTETRLMAILENTGFTATTLIKRFPYRNVNGHMFYSLTYRAVKPCGYGTVNAMYRGPLPFLVTEKGEILPKGQRMDIDGDLAGSLGDQIFIMDETGSVTNIEAENTCACYRAPEQSATTEAVAFTSAESDPKQNVNCMVCGSYLVYENFETHRRCHYCGEVFSTLAACSSGHFVCDSCHAKDALDVIRHICLTTDETDLLKLFEQIRRHPAVPMHGPEYHAMIPGIILACYRNSGGKITKDTILDGISRGSTVAGGFCGFMGICGAAVGLGAAFSLILEANPLKGKERQWVQTAVQKTLKDIGDLNAARCCQRDGSIALKKAAELSEELLGIPLKAEYQLVCRQRHMNRECPGSLCPLFGKSEKKDLFIMV